MHSAWRLRLSAVIILAGPPLADGCDRWQTIPKAVGMNDSDLDSSHRNRVPVLYARVGDQIQDAPEADQAVARSYPPWDDKGAVANGRRLTILTARDHVHPGEEIRVVHVAEATEPSGILYITGPKTVLGEYVDGQLVTAPSPGDDDPLRPPGLYDGPVVRGPAIDFGYEVSVYRFEAGTHRIIWRLGNLASNELVVSVQ
jgi:hypothetical protein